MVFRCVVVGLFVVMPLFNSCGTIVAESNDEHLAIHDFSFREGDLVFRRGRGMVSHAVLYADVEGVYSHVGIVVKQGTEMKVVHAVPGEPDFEGDVDRVKMESVEVYFKKSNASRGCVMRYEGDSVVVRNAAENAKRIYENNVLFDHDYDHQDTVKMYCTELIYYVYKRQGVDMVEERMQDVNLPGFNGIYIFPSGIQESKHLKEVHYF